MTTEEKICGRCGGTGFRFCRKCKGTGELDGPETCPHCHGAGGIPCSCGGAEKASIGVGNQIAGARDAAYGIFPGMRHLSLVRRTACWPAPADVAMDVAEMGDNCSFGFPAGAAVSSTCARFGLDISV